MRNALACLVAIIATVPVHAGFSTTELLVPAGGRATGAGGSEFSSTLWITNPTAAPASVQIQFLLSGQANTAPATFNDQIAPGATRVYEDIAGTLFHANGLVGAARITSNAAVIVASRAHTNNVGVSISGVPPEAGVRVGETGIMQGVRQTPDFR